MVLVNEDSCASFWAPQYLSFITATIAGTLSVFTVIGNLMVCVSVVKDPYKELRTPFNFYIINLALADLIVGLVTEPIAVWVHIREGFSLTMENVWIIHMSYFISCTASLLSLCALTVDRYKAITTPLKHRVSGLSLQRTLFTSGLIWIFSLSIPFIYFKLGFLTYSLVFANTAVSITFITLFFAYVRIFLTLRAQVKRWSSRDKKYGCRIRRNAILREERITKVFLLILVLFVCCYSPSCAMIYVMNLCKSCSCYTLHWLRDLQFLFVLLSSSLNPFVYAWRMPSFRKAFMSLVKQKKDLSTRLVANISDATPSLKEIENFQVKSK